MPVTIGIKSMNGLVALKKLKIEDDDFEWLAGSGLKVDLTSKAFTFSHPDLGPVAEIPVKLEFIQALNKGTAATADLVFYRGEFYEILPHLHSVVDEDPILEIEKGALGMLAPKTVIKAMDEMGEPAKPAKPAPPPAPQALGWPVYDKATMGTGKMVKLRDATKMYQPVEGTTQGSRYFVVAGNKGLRVAARYQGHSLSVRVEGEDFANHVGAITKAGLAAKGNHYASVHLQVSDDIIASKALGAILMGLGIEFETSLPKVSIFKGK